MNRIRRVYPIVLAIISLSLVLVACTKESAAPAPSSFIESFHSTSRIPAESFVVFLSAPNSEAGKKYDQSPWGKASNNWQDTVLQSLPGEQTPGRKQIEDMLSALETAGILNHGQVSSTAVQEYALVGIMNSTTPRADLGVIVNCKSKTVCEAAYQSLQKSQSATRIGESSAMKFDIAGSAAGESATPVYFDLDGDYLLLSLDEQLLKKLRPNDASNWALTSKNNPSLNRALAKLPRRGEAFSLGVLNLSEMLGALPTTDGKPIKSPFQHVVFSSQMSENLHFVAASTVDASQSEAKWFTDMRSAERMPAFSVIPSDAVGAIGLQLTAFHSIHDMLFPYLTPEQQAKAAPLAAALDGVIGASIAVRGARGASPFPELLIAIETKDAKALADQIGAALGALAAGGGLPISPIQTKEIGGNPVQFVSTPLGVGIFLAHKDGKVVATSAEGLMADVLGSTVQPLQTALSRTGQDIVKQEGQLGSLYIDYTKGVNMVEGLQASLAMFTGGAGQLDRSSLEPFRAMGSTTAVVYLDKDALLVESVYERPKG